MKTNKISVYLDKKSKSIFICPMEDKDGKFVTKTPTKDFGKAVSYKVTDEELGKLIKKYLEED